MCNESGEVFNISTESTYTFLMADDTYEPDFAEYIGLSIEQAMQLEINEIAEQVAGAGVTTSFEVKAVSLGNIKDFVISGVSSIATLGYIQGVFVDEGRETPQKVLGVRTQSGVSICGVIRNDEQCVLDVIANQPPFVLTDDDLDYEFIKLAILQDGGLTFVDAHTFAGQTVYDVTLGEYQNLKFT